MVRCRAIGGELRNNRRRMLRMRNRLEVLHEQVSRRQETRTAEIDWPAGRSATPPEGSATTQKPSTAIRSAAAMRSTRLIVAMTRRLGRSSLIPGASRRLECSHSTRQSTAQQVSDSLPLSRHDIVEHASMRPATDDIILEESLVAWKRSPTCSGSTFQVPIGPAITMEEPAGSIVTSPGRPTHASPRSRRLWI
jgi:hypothetical protein